jgi:hypothetical protein
MPPRQGRPAPSPGPPSATASEPSAAAAAAIFADLQASPGSSVTEVPDHAAAPPYLAATDLNGALTTSGVYNPGRHDPYDSIAAVPVPPWQHQASFPDVSAYAPMGNDPTFNLANQASSFPGGTNFLDGPYMDSSIGPGWMINMPLGQLPGYRGDLPLPPFPISNPGVDLAAFDTHQLGSNESRAVVFEPPSPIKPLRTSMAPLAVPRSPVSVRPTSTSILPIHAGAEQQDGRGLAPPDEDDEADEPETYAPVRHPTQSEWAELRAVLKDLYIDQQRPLQELMMNMHLAYAFSGT